MFINEVPSYEAMLAASPQAAINTRLLAGSHKIHYKATCSIHLTLTPYGEGNFNWVQNYFISQTGTDNT